MSLSQETLFDLMALADGELEGDARERAEKLVSQSEEARRIVEGMRSPALGRLLKLNSRRDLGLISPGPISPLTRPTGSPTP